MKSISLVILAGGLGSRFGGDKQLEPVGPNGEVFFDYAIREALKIGLEKILIVARSDLDSELRKHLFEQHPKNFSFEIVHQDLLEPIRKKPWGTGHAVLAAVDKHLGPMIVMNADDYYGPTALQRLLSIFKEENAALLAFELSQTIPETGKVSRGILSVEKEKLLSIRELHGIEKKNDGFIADSNGEVLSEDTFTSMNLWALPVTSLRSLKKQWSRFLEENRFNKEAEFLLPSALDEQRSKQNLIVKVLRSNEKWIGITNPEDLKLAKIELAD